MSEPEIGFENAKIGDKVYSPLFKSVNVDDKTNATINRIDPSSNTVYIKPDIYCGSIAFFFDFDGCYGSNGGQVLYWENPIKEIPTRPKRKVMKKGFIGVIPDKAISKGRIALTSNAYESRDCELIPDGYQIIKIEFEVEE